MRPGEHRHGLFGEVDDVTAPVLGSRGRQRPDPLIQIDLIHLRERRPGVRACEGLAAGGDANQHNEQRGQGKREHFSPASAIGRSIRAATSASVRATPNDLPEDHHAPEVTLRPFGKLEID